MNKKEIAERLRQEVGELEVAIKKVHARCERLKKIVLDLEDELAGPAAQKPEPESQFRKAIDRVFGETPKRAKR